LTVVYPDTSFLLPLYLPDSHSVTAQSYFAQKPILVLTPFQQAEFTNSIWQQVFRRKLTSEEASIVLHRFRQDAEDGVFAIEHQPAAWLDSAPSVMRFLTPTLGLRTLDALHISIALALNLQVFWSFDDRQRQAAKAIGLTVNPLD
jgi:predicted nucleic acid-binding protein